jgi:type IV pilus assembly protein PilA
MKLNRSKKGFTLVEIMIVVVIIGLLAAMAIPAFQKVRQNSIGKAMENDARQIAAAAQQYILENAGITTITIGVSTSDGSVTGILSEYVKKISKGTVVGNYNGTVAASVAAFTMSNPQLGAVTTVNFDAEGKKL